MEHIPPVIVVIQQSLQQDRSQVNLHYPQVSVEQQRLDVAIFFGITLSTWNGTGGGVTLRNEPDGCVGAKGFNF